MAGKENVQPVFKRDTKHVRFEAPIEDVQAPRPFDRPPNRPFQTQLLDRMPEPLKELEVTILDAGPPDLGNNCFDIEEKLPYTAIPDSRTPLTIAPAMPQTHFPSKEVITTAWKSKPIEAPNTNDYGFFTVPHSNVGPIQYNEVKINRNEPISKPTPQPVKKTLPSAVKQPRNRRESPVKVNRTMRHRSCVQKPPIEQICDCTHAEDNIRDYTSHCHCNISPCCVPEQRKHKSAPDNEPSLSDLYSIIKTQNEQLQNLQKRLDQLSEFTAKEKTEPRIFTEEEIRSKSIGVMTSFEMRMTSVINTKSSKFADGCVQTSQISGKILNTPIFNGNDGLIAKMQPTQPILSKLRPDVSDYTDLDEESLDSDNGWTFYDNVMNNVDKILSSPPDAIQRTNPERRSFNSKPKPNTSTNMTRKVTFEACNTVPVDSNEQFTEMSLHMKKLAVKYSKQSDNKSSSEFSQKEMSFSTLQYMQKHNLLPGRNTNLKSRENRFPQLQETERFLDITAIRRQPKLL